MKETIEPSRRRFLSLLGGIAGSALLLATLPQRSRAADLPHLSDSDPTAKALHYTEDASKAPPPHKAGQECANCKFFSGTSGQAYGPCQLYPGKSVAAKGWCAGYSAKA